MFGLEYLLALMKIFTQIAFAIITAIPFYCSWNCIAPIYLTFIPEVYWNLPFWHIVASFLVAKFLGELVPTIVSISQTNS